MNRPLQTLTLAAALSCTMATGWASILTQTPNQKNNDYEMFTLDLHPRITDKIEKINL